MTTERAVTSLVFRSLDEKKRSVDFVASTDAIDSYGEIVEQTWRLDRFNSNPVILFSHDSRSLPIGQATRCEVTEANGRKQLECTIQLATAEANPLAEQVWQSINQKTLRSVSVGFVPNDYRYEKRNGQEVLVLADNELHEISVVAIPANPEALAKMRARAAKQREHGDSAEGTIHMTTTEEAIKKAADAEARASNADKEIAVEKAAHEVTKSALAESRQANTKNEARIEALEKQLADATSAALEREVDALVGVKILPTEKASMLKLAKLDKELFLQNVAERPTLKLADPVMKGGNGETENKSSTVTNAASASDELTAAMNAAAE